MPKSTTGRDEREPPAPFEPKWFPWFVKLIITCTALVLLIKEASRPNDVRPELLFLYAWMMGLPGVVSFEQLRRRARRRLEEPDEV